MVLTLLELVFLALMLGGIALLSIPAAMIVAGAVGVLAVEYAQRARSRPSPAPVAVKDRA